MIELIDGKFANIILPRDIKEDDVFTLEDYLYIKSMRIKTNNRSSYYKAKRKKWHTLRSLKKKVEQSLYIKEKYG